MLIQFRKQYSPQHNSVFIQCALLSPSKMNFFWLFALCVLSISAAESPPPDCDYDHSTRTYYCNKIVEVFPKKFYGNYHLKCVRCHIEIFSNNTFPYTNNLVSFNVSESGIKTVAERAFSSLSNAQYLYLQHNEILEIYPNAFYGLRQVYELHLEHNRIVNIFLGFLNEAEVNSVDLSHNRLREISNAIFTGNMGLLTLDLSWNRIRKLGAHALFDLDQLEMLSLAHNELCGLPLGLFRYSPSLRVLDLANNKLSKFGFGVFSGLQNLQSLTLANNSLVTVDSTILAPFNRLTNLDISGNGIYYMDAHEIFQNVPSLKLIQLNDNLFSCSLLTNVLQYFKKARVEVASYYGRYDVQNINGIACTDATIYQIVDFDLFLQTAKEDSKKYQIYC